MKERRLWSDLNSIKKDPPEGCSAGPINIGELDKWRGIIIGPPGSVYEGGIFELSISFPAFYPFAPPKVSFNTRIYHPNILEKNVCLDILKSGWSPILSVDKVLLSIMCLLQDPNPKDPLNREAAELYLENRSEYNRKAREWVRLYASKHKSEE